MVANDMQVGYKLYEDFRDTNHDDFIELQIKMARVCAKNGWSMEAEYDEDGRRYLIIKPPYEPPLSKLKSIKHNEARKAFAQKRDAVRFIQLDDKRKYGFDCANEDVTNFMASYIPLLIMQGGTTEYKVYLNEDNLKEKKLVELSFEDMHKTYLEVSTSQKSDYKWYESIVAQIKACTTKDELNGIKLL